MLSYNIINFMIVGGVGLIIFFILRNYDAQTILKTSELDNDDLKNICNV